MEGTGIKIPLRIYCSALLVFAAALTFLFLNYTFTDDSKLKTDDKEYHALAVHLVLGKGYKFNGPIGNPFYREPGYPVFLSLVYKITGVHPISVRELQAVLLAAAIAFLPIMGFMYWSWSGCWAGLIAAFIYTVYYCPDPTVLMTETLLLFLLVLFLVPYMIWEGDTTTFNSFIVGIALGVLLLVQELTVFMPVLCGFYLHRLTAFMSIEEKIKRWGAFLLGLLLLVMSWSLFASYQNKKLVFVTTRNEYCILDAYNELTIMTGHWSPEWRKSSNKAQRDYFFYNQPGIKARPAAEKLGAFLVRYKDQVPVMLKRKLFFGFKFNKAYLWIPAFLGFYVMAYFRKENKGKVPTYPLLYFLNLFLIVVLIFGMDRFIQVFMYFILLPAIYFVFQIFNMVKGRLLGKVV